MLFFANPYEVEIWEGGKKAHLLKINDASSTFRSIKLDKLEEKTKQVFEKMSAIQEEIGDILENKSDVLIIDLPEEDKSALEKIDSYRKEMRLLNAEYVQILVKDCDTQEELIDSIPGNELQAFYGAIKRASLGNTDTRPGLEKKKTKPKTKSVKSLGKSLSKNSTGGDTRRKK